MCIYIVQLAVYQMLIAIRFQRWRHSFNAGRKHRLSIGYDRLLYLLIRCCDGPDPSNAARTSE
jgi:hypothetical protein